MLKEAGEFLAFIFGNLFKGIWFLIRKAGLWVPLAFIALFFIIVGVTRTPFNTVKAVFIAGLILTTVIGIAFGVAVNAKKLIGSKLPEKNREGKITRAKPPPRPPKPRFPRPAKPTIVPPPRTSPPITRTKNSLKSTAPAAPPTSLFTSTPIASTITAYAETAARNFILNIRLPTAPFPPATF